MTFKNCSHKKKNSKYTNTGNDALLQNYFYSKYLLINVLRTCKIVKVVKLNNAIITETIVLESNKILYLR